jgi:hypothetical protein
MPQQSLGHVLYIYIKISLMKRTFTFSILSLLITFFNLESSGQTGFVENKGQVVDQFGVPNSDALFVLPLAGMNVVLYQDGFSYNVFQSKEGYVPACEVIRNNTFIDAKKLKEDARVNVYRVDIKFLNSSLPNVRSVGKLQGVKNYFTTGTPEVGVTGVNTFEKVLMEGMYPGIDVEFTYSKNKGLEYNFIVSSEGNYEDIQMKYFGFSELNLEESILKIKVKDGIELEERIPASWIKQSGELISFNYDVNRDIVSFRTDSEISNHSIVIDPTPNLVYATYFGGEGFESIYDQVIDFEGNVYLVGSSSSTQGVATTGSYQSTLAGILDITISKFSDDNDLDWSTYYGGSSEEGGYDAVFSQGKLIVCGFTYSEDGIASAGSFQTLLNGLVNGVVCCLLPTGELSWGTYFGMSNDFFYGVDIFDNLIGLVGRSQSTELPLAGDFYKTSNNGNADGIFVTSDLQGNIIYNSFVGGNGNDELYQISMSNEFGMFMIGRTESSDLPVTNNAIDQQLSSSSDILLFGMTMQYSPQFISYYGNSGDEIFAGLARFQNTMYLIGRTTNGTSLTTETAYQANQVGTSDLLLTVLNDNFDITYCTLFGGSGFDEGRIVFVDESGIYLAGLSSSSDGIITENSFQQEINLYPDEIYGDAFISKFDFNNELIWSTYFGDFSYEDIRGLSFFNGELIISGAIGSSESFPLDYQSFISTPGAYQENHGGASDGFIARFDAVTGVRELGLDDVSWNVFPNPSSSEVNIELPIGERNWQLDFYDVQGKNVLQKSVQTDFIAIDILSLPTGVYTLKARNEHHSLSMKVVKR